MYIYIYIPRTHVEAGDEARDENNEPVSQERLKEGGTNREVTKLLVGKEK